MAIRPYVGEEALRELVRQIKQRTASVYTVKGSIGVRTLDESTQQYVHTPANLPYYMYSNPSAGGIYVVYDGNDNIVQTKEGWVFNLAIDYTVPEGSVWFIDRVPGDIIKAGTNICVVNSETLPNKKFDCLATDVDLTPYQTKELSSALTMLTPDFTYDTVAAMPTTGATAEGIETGDIAYVTETTKLYQATVDDSDNITWAEIGDQTTVEGAIKLLGSLAPNRPVTAAEVQSLFNS